MTMYIVKVFLDCLTNFGCDMISHYFCDVILNLIIPIKIHKILEYFNPIFKLNLNVELILDLKKDTLNWNYITLNANISNHLYNILILCICNKI